MDIELTKLIREAKKGSQEAFTKLVSKYKAQVFRHAYAMVNDRMEAEDIAQEAFVKAYLSLSKLDNEYAFVSWLTRIVSNLCYDKLKKNQKLKELTIETDIKIMTNTTDIDRSQLRLELKEALKKLSIDHRTALVLRDVQGFSYEEISGILNIPIGTVKSRINSARLALKKDLSRGDQNE
ncbi:RNA polymerase sigma factor [Heyndrickxia sp. NPDC080065]|uniref:RNA polymerase sigma factor n=1 Tax=Heyndrickxia sp. NPDC080065 TaxID=3390568 RepID=UPI003D022151